jgi:predicted DNA-binding protein
MRTATAESPNIRISPSSKATLRALARRKKKPMQKILDEAIEQYRRDMFFRDLDESYARLRADPKAWKRELAERQEWDATLMDGLRGE